MSKRGMLSMLVFACCPAVAAAEASDPGSGKRLRAVRTGPVSASNVDRVSPEAMADRICRHVFWHLSRRKVLNLWVIFPHAVPVAAQGDTKTRVPGLPLRRGLQGPSEFKDGLD